MASYMQYFKGTLAMLHKGSQFFQEGEVSSNSLILQMVTVFAHVC